MSVYEDISIIIRIIVAEMCVADLPLYYKIQCSHDTRQNIIETLAHLTGLDMATISLLFPMRKMEHDQRAPAVSPTLSSTAPRPNTS
jgi:hypothetical protein